MAQWQICILNISTRLDASAVRSTVHQNIRWKSQQPSLASSATCALGYFHEFFSFTVHWVHRKSSNLWEKSQIAVCTCLHLLSFLKIANLAVCSTTEEDTTFNGHIIKTIRCGYVVWTMLYILMMNAWFSKRFSQYFLIICPEGLDFVIIHIIIIITKIKIVPSLNKEVKLNWIFAYPAVCKFLFFLCTT